MSDFPKILGQANPAATTLTDVYTVPSATSAVLSTVVACNQGTSTAEIRISAAVAGAGDTAAQYLFFDIPLQPKQSFPATIGVTLAATDVLRVYASTANVSFNAFGTEIV